MGLGISLVARIEGVVSAPEVGSGAKTPPGSGEDGDPDVIVAVDSLGDVEELFEHRTVEGV